MWRIWRWELMGIFSLVGICSLGSSLQLAFSGFGYKDLRDLESFLRQSLPYWVVPLGIVTASSLRVHSASSVVVGAAPGRYRSLIILRQLVLLSGATLAGAIAGLLPVVAFMAFTQYSTIVDAIWLLAYLAGLASVIPIAAAFSLLGGRVSRYPIAVIGALVTLLVPALYVNLYLLQGRAYSLTAVSYVWAVGFPSRGEVLSLPVGVLRICFFALIWLVFVKIAQGLGEWRVSLDRVGLLRILWLALPVALSAFVAQYQPILVYPDPGDQVRCQRSNGIELCLYQIDESKRDYVLDVIRPIDPVLTIFGIRTITEDPDSDLLTVSRVFGDKVSWATLEGRSLVLGAFDPVNANCDFGEAGTAIKIAVQIDLFTRAARNSADPDVAEAYSRAAGDSVGVSEVALNRLSALPDGAFYDWLSTHRDGVVACTLGDSDLPG